MSDQRSYIVRIGGLSGDASDEAVGYCGPILPAFASAPEYVVGLAALVTGGGGEWSPLELTASLGGFEVVLHRDASGGPNLTALTPPPLCTTLTALSSVTNTLDLDVLAVDAGIGVGSRLFIEAETILVDAIDGTYPYRLTIERGIAGSRASTHLAGVRVYGEPPHMVGRSVTLSACPVDAASASEEVVIRRGYVQRPQAHGGMSVTLSADTGFGDGRLPRRIQTLSLQLRRSVSSGDIEVLSPPIDYDDGYVHEPIYHADGAHFVVPDLGVVLTADYDSGWRFRTRLTAGDPADVPEDGTFVMAFEVAWSGGEYSPFPSRNPADVARTLLTSLDGTNGAYDVARLATLSARWPVAQVDEDAFARLRDSILVGAEAEIWLGGQIQESVPDTLRRLLGPYGVTVLLTPSGVVRPVWVRDVVQGDATPDLGGYLARDTASRWTQEVVERAADSIVLVTELYPGQSGGTIDLSESSGESLYRDSPVTVGGTLRVERAALRSSDALTVDSPVNRAAARIFAAGALKLGTGNVICTRSAQEAVAHGDEVQIQGPVPVLRDPVDGSAIGADRALLGLVTRVGSGMESTDIGLIITGTTSTRFARWSASATVVAYDPDTLELTVEAVEWYDDGTGDDATTFAAPYIVDLLTPEGELRSTASAAQVASVATETITLADHWADDLGDMDGDSGRRLPRAGDLVVFGSASEVTAAQLVDWAYLASVISAYADPQVDGGAPYVYAAA